MYKKSKKTLDMRYEINKYDDVTHDLLMMLMPAGFTWLADVENASAVDSDTLALATAIYSLRHYGILGPQTSKEWLQ